MTDTESFDGTGDWQRFVINHGYGASGFDLAAVLQRPIADIARIRATGASSKSGCRTGFVDLFRLRHGREPCDDEWPPPRKQGGRGSYEWQGPELALLATLVGRLSKEEIAQVLTQRLRDVTGNPTAVRNPTAVQVAINRIGMQSSDVLSGITTAEAGREIGSLAIVNQAIHKGDIRAVRVGRLWVIPHETWKTWKSKRIFPPTGYVPLAKLKGPLSIRSDKLSEFARLGYVPTAIRCNPYGAGPSTQFGTWYLDEGVANRLIADRRAGQPMPWHGKPLTDNLRATYKLWQDRKHPTTCKTCAAIWGSDGAPQDFDAYVRRYPPLAHGAKRHLTMIWSAGLTVRQVAKQAGCSEKAARLAAANGALDASYDTGRMRVSRTAATRWISGGCSSGDSRRSWISLATARKRYLFTKRELMDLIARRELKSRTGTDGAARGVVYVSSQQCVCLRNASGFTEHEAARRAHVSVRQFRAVLEGLNWRETGAIPLSTVQAVIKRLQSHPGYSIERAARELGRSIDWVEARVKDGTVRVLRRAWEPDHVYLSKPMMNRLRQAPATPNTEVATGPDWLRLGTAAREAGVTTATIIKWAECGELQRTSTPTGWKYARENVRARARAYWKTVRFHRAIPPQWLAGESNG